MKMSRLSNPPIISSVQGKIGLLMMAVTDNDGAAQFGRIYGFYRVMPAHTTLLVWCNNHRARTTLEEWLIAQGADPVLITITDPLALQAGKIVLTAPPGATTLKSYSHWVRDPFLLLWRNDGIAELVKSTHTKTNDTNWAEKEIAKIQIEGKNSFLLSNMVLKVAGGNILFDEDFILLGHAQFKASAGNQTIESMRAELMDLFNSERSEHKFKRVIEIGTFNNSDSERVTEPSLLQHIDMYLSLTGKKKNGKYLVLVAECKIIDDIPLQNTEKTILNVNAYLDQVCKQLETEGFQVIRNSIPVLFNPKTRRRYLGAYNNCLLEVQDENNAIVWLAKISQGQEMKKYYKQLVQIEEENKNIWQGLGFEVRMVEAEFDNLLDNQGSLHCLTNELLRFLNTRMVA